MTLVPYEIEFGSFDLYFRIRLNIDTGRCRHKEERCVEDSHDDNKDHVDPGVVSNLVCNEANDGRTHENREWENGVDEGEVHVTDAQVLGMDGQVGDDSISRPGEHKEGYLEG